MGGRLWMGWSAVNDKERGGAAANADADGVCEWEGGAVNGSEGVTGRVGWSARAPTAGRGRPL